MAWRTAAKSSSRICRSSPRATAALDRRFGVAFVDVDAGTLNLDPARVEAAIVPGKTRAIMPVHQFGQPADMTALQRIARTHGLKIIEDAAQAHGAEWESGPAGSLGDAAAFSFQSAKNLACGEGGVLTTNDDAYFDRAFSIHNAGRSRELEARWEHVALGWNIRATEYQAALLLDRLGDFDDQQRVRAANFSRLRDQLKDVSCVTPLAGASRRPASRHVHVRDALRIRRVQRPADRSIHPRRQCGGDSTDPVLRLDAVGPGRHAGPAEAASRVRSRAADARLGSRGGRDRLSARQRVPRRRVGHRRHSGRASQSPGPSRAPRRPPS